MKIFIVLLLLLIYISLTYIKPSSIKLDSNFKIEIKGNVKNKGVYEVSKGDIIDDVLKRAIVLKDSDLSTINKSSKLYPNMVINIPKLTSLNKISINSASLKDLCTLPGIKEKMANRIIEYRKVRPFKSLEEIMNVKGIGIKTYEKLKDLIAL